VLDQRHPVVELGGLQARHDVTGARATRTLISGAVLDDLAVDRL
jgi:hypothetical protein